MNEGENDGKDEAENGSEDCEESDVMNQDESDGEVGARDEPEDGDQIDGVNESESDRAEDETEDKNIEDEGDNGSKDDGEDKDEYFVDLDDSGEDYPTIERKKPTKPPLISHNVKSMAS